MQLEYELSSTVIAAMVAYLLAAVSGILLYRRAHNRRIRFISVVMSVLPVYAAIRLVRESQGSPTVGSGELPEMFELAVAAMFLLCVRVLQKESVTRTQTEQCLRLAEGVVGWSIEGSGKPTVKDKAGRMASPRERRCLQCNQPVRGLRKWRSNSPFCSDAHRDVYFTENAATRLGDLAAAIGSAVVVKPAVVRERS